MSASVKYFIHNRVRIVFKSKHLESEIIFFKITSKFSMSNHSHSLLPLTVVDRTKGLHALYPAHFMVASYFSTSVMIFVVAMTWQFVPKSSFVNEANEHFLFYDFHQIN